MPIEVKLEADSINGNPGSRLTTWKLRFPRFILAQVLTHRQFSRNAQSSRAIPTKKLIELTESDPARPVSWGVNKKGMSADEEYMEEDLHYLDEWWISLLTNVVYSVESLQAAGYNPHKEIINRVVEPWSNVSVILSTTSHQNFFNLRCSEHAHPEIQEVAYAMRSELHASTPVVRSGVDWHIPMVTEEERKSIPQADLIKVATGRCARVSYLTHEGRRDISKDIDLHDRLLKDGHWSAFEHCALPLMNRAQMSGNFRGWKQYRKFYPKECVQEQFVRITDDGWEYVDSIPH